MKKTKNKVLSSIVIATMVLGANFPAAVFANVTTSEPNKVVDRLFGDDRYETAANVALEGWDKSEFAILAPGANANLVDSLTAAPFANSLKAPILLTNGTELPEVTVNALKELKVKKVYLVSGKIDEKQVAKAFKENNLDIEVVENIGGEDRYETATNIAKKLQNVKGVVVTTALTYADALSVAPIAAANNMPILLSKKDEMPKVEADYLKGIEKSIEKTYVLGGEGLVGAEVYEELPGEKDSSKKRLAGDNRYETNLEVLNEFDNLKYDKVYIANGQNSHLVDALVVSSLAAQTDSPVVLVDKELSQDAEKLLLENINEGQLIALGGEAFVDNRVLTFNHLRPQDFGVMQTPGVNGYSVGFEVINAKASDIEKAEVALYKGDKLLAKNTSMAKLFNEFKDATQFSSPFNVDGDFTADGYWNYGTWKGTTNDVPTKAVITVTLMNGNVYTVETMNLTGDPDTLNQEALKHLKVDSFGVMQHSGVNGYSVGFTLVDGKKVSDLENIEISLYKTEENEDKEKVDVILATNTATRKTNAKLFELGVNTISTPFNIDGPFEADGYWTYGKYQGTVKDIPSKAVVKIKYQDGREFEVTSKVLTGDPAHLGNPEITTNLPEKLTVDTETAFSISTLINNFAVDPDSDTTEVRAKITFTKGDDANVDLQYKEGEMFKALTFKDNVTFFGPEAESLFTNATSDFKLAIKEAGTYEYKIEIITIAEGDKDSKVLASYEGKVVVEEAVEEVEETAEITE